VELAAANAARQQAEKLVRECENECAQLKAERDTAIDALDPRMPDSRAAMSNPQAAERAASRLRHAHTDLKRFESALHNARAQEQVQKQAWEAAARRADAAASNPVEHGRLQGQSWNKRSTWFTSAKKITRFWSANATPRSMPWIKQHANCNSP
jgi:hypothetical protein